VTRSPVTLRQTPMPTTTGKYSGEVTPRLDGFVPVAID